MPRRDFNSFDADIVHAIESCVRAGTDRARMAELRDALFENTQGPYETREKKTTRTVLTVLVSAAIFLTCYADWCKLLASSRGRHLLNGLLPYWDWTDLYYRDCLLSNPLYERRRLSSDDCDSCENSAGHGQIWRIANASSEDIADYYISGDVPVVVTDAVQGPPVSVLRLASAFALADPEGRTFPCSMRASVKSRGDNPLRSLLGAIEKGNLKRWFAHWENCDKSAAKVARQVMGRPYFLPPMVDATDPNWILLSVNYTSRDYKEISPVSDLVWVSVLLGELSAKLTPRSPCDGSCSSALAILKAGDSLLFTDRMWSFGYKFGDEGSHVAVAGGGTCEL